MTLSSLPAMRARRWSLVLTVGLVLTTVLSACGQPAPEFAEPAEAAVGQPSSNDPPGRVLFVANGEVSQWDGDIRTIVSLDNEVNYRTESPTWAPDGSRFAYVERYEGYSDIIVANADGGTLTQVTTNEPDAEPFSIDYACLAYWAFDPVWSPAGEQLIWVSDRDGFEDYFCGPEGRLSDPLYMWYSEDVGGDQDVLSYILSSSVGVGDTQENPTLSPDGESAAFTARVGGESLRNTQVWSIQLAGGESTVLVDAPDGAFDPAWSPDGDTIAYVQRTGTASDVWVVPSDGGDPYQLTSVGTAISPAWSPDGRFLAFFRVEEGEIEAAYIEVTDDGNRLTAS